MQLLLSWIRTAICASALFLVGCGDGTDSRPASATTPAKAAAAVDPLAIQNIGMKMMTSCAVRGDGAARCWGRNAQSWDQSKKSVTGPLKQLMLDSDSQHNSCALNQEGTVFCWNDNGNAESLGRGALQDKGDPKKPVAVLSNASQIDIGNGTVCALTNDGDVYCWGGASYKQSSDPRVDRPTKILGLPKIKQVSVGLFHRCGVGVDSGVWCWGYFDYSDGTGRNDVFRTDNPFRVEIPMGGAMQVSVGALATCAVSVRSASVFCWGANDYGQIGNNDKPKPALYPQKALFESGEMTRQVSVGTDYACAMLASGAARCWGRTRMGILGNGEGGMYGPQAGYKAKPVRVQNSQGEFFGFKGLVTSLEPSHPFTTCAWGEGNQAWCWGWGVYGELGDGEQGNSHYVNTPKRVTVIESGWI